MADFLFVNAAYSAQSPYQDDQECINWYPEVDMMKNPGSPQFGDAAQRGTLALYPTPGLVFLAQLNSAEVRCLHVLPGRNVMLAICGYELWEVDANFSTTNTGTILTNSGQVSIADNGIEAIIFDGPNRYSYNLTTKVLSPPLTDGAFIGGIEGEVLDNFILYAQGGSQKWAATNIDSTVTEALSFASKFSDSDNLVTLIVDHRQVYLLGEVTTEAWVDVGSFPFPYAIIPGSTMQHGCAAIRSVARLGNSFAFVSQDTRGQIIILMMNGYAAVPISTKAIEFSLVDQLVSDATAFTYRMSGHEFYVITFPSIQTTWVYDLSTNLWHKWLSWDPLHGFNRHRSNCSASFQNLVVVGDYSNGSLYSLSLSTYTDNGLPIKRVRRGPHIVSDFQRIFFQELQIQFQPGVGLPDDTIPQAILKWSDDGGSTWSNEHWASIGIEGYYTNRTIWRRLGWARDRIFEVSVTDPINAVIVSANIKTTLGVN